MAPYHHHVCVTVLQLNQSQAQLLSAVNQQLHQNPNVSGACSLSVAGQPPHTHFCPPHALCMGGDADLDPYIPTLLDTLPWSMETTHLCRRLPPTDPCPASLHTLSWRQPMYAGALTL